MKQDLLGNIDLPVQVRVLSHTPERVRVRLGKPWRTPETMTQIAVGLQQMMPSIRQVKFNPQLGSLTLYLMPEEGFWEDPFNSLINMGIIAIAPSPEIAPSASEQLTGMVTAWNDQVNGWTKGTADLRFLVPLAIFLLALRRWMANKGTLKSAPWYVLVWYAFDTFMKLNPPSTALSQTSSTPESASMVNSTVAPVMTQTVPLPNPSHAVESTESITNHHQQKRRLPRSRPGNDR